MNCASVMFSYFLADRQPKTSSLRAFSEGVLGPRLVEHFENQFPVIFTDSGAGTRYTISGLKSDIETSFGIEKMINPRGYPLPGEGGTGFKKV